MFRRFSQLQNISIYILFIIAYFIASYQLLYNRSLWVDEADLAVSIVKRNYIGLLQPLDNFQMAPILYLWVVKFSSSLIPDNEIGLRLPSFIAYLGTLHLFYQFLKNYVKNGIALVLGLALMIFNFSLLYYSQEVKQYMTEALVTMCLIYITFVAEWHENKKLLVSAIVGSLSIPLSHVGVLSLPALYLCLLLPRWRNWDFDFVWKMLGIALLWGLLFGAYYSTFLHVNPNIAVMRKVHVSNFSKADSDLISMILIRWWNYERILSDFGLSFKNTRLGLHQNVYNLSVVIIMLTIFIGIWRAFKINTKLVLILIPLVLHIFLIEIKFYPPIRRLFLHLYPILGILIVFGLDHILRFAGFTRPYLTPIIYVLIFGLGLLFVKVNLPMQREEARDCLKKMAEKSKPGDGLYVYVFGTGHFEYYTKTSRYTPSGKVTFSKQAPIKNLDAKGYWKNYMAELPMKEGPFWIFFTHVYKKDEKRMLDSLKANPGNHISDSVKTFDASAYRIIPATP